MRTPHAIAWRHVARCAPVVLAATAVTIAVVTASPLSTAYAGDTYTQVVPISSSSGSNVQKMQGQSMSASYSASVLADGNTQTSNNSQISTTDANTNSFLAKNGGSLTVSGDTVSKSGDSTDTEQASGYGTNAIAAAVGQNSFLKISDSQLNATSIGSNGIFAADSATAYAYNNSISTSADVSCGIAATNNGTAIGNNASISTQGIQSAGISAGAGETKVSVANTSVSTSGQQSPILQASGTLDADNVQGVASNAQIARMDSARVVSVDDSNLSSTMTKAAASDPAANGVLIFGSGAESSNVSHTVSRFQSDNSTLQSSIKSGAMFYLTNAHADIVLSNTTLNFDSTAADLLNAQGNTTGWGTPGKNGARVSFTGINETLSGDVSCDSISQAKVYLLSGSNWSGITEYAGNPTESNTSHAVLDVNVDSSSTWTVTGDCMVSHLNVANGGKVVDESGNPVTIVDVHGTVCVQGSSDTTVVVADGYSNNVTTSSANQLSTSTIDRSGFDSAFGTHSECGQNSGDAGATSSNSRSGNGNAFANAIAWVRGLLGLGN